MKKEKAQGLHFLKDASYLCKQTWSPSMSLGKKRLQWEKQYFLPCFCQSLFGQRYNFVFINRKVLFIWDTLLSLDSPLFLSLQKQESKNQLCSKFRLGKQLLGQNFIMLMYILMERGKNHKQMLFTVSGKVFTVDQPTLIELINYFRGQNSIALKVYKKSSVNTILWLVYFETNTHTRSPMICCHQHCQHFSEEYASVRSWSGEECKFGSLMIFYVAVGTKLGTVA